MCFLLLCSVFIVQDLSRLLYMLSSLTIQTSAERPWQESRWGRWGSSEGKEPGTRAHCCLPRAFGSSVGSLYCWLP